uniref:isopeptide-forming domain-containing fimbrial protein n=1 Tax=Microbulbifer litoralis TaxID=2933965 RepID=UPI0020295089
MLTIILKKTLASCGRSTTSLLFSLLLLTGTGALAQTSVQNNTNVSHTEDLTDPDPGNNEATTDTPVLPAPVVGYSKSADVTDVSVGDTVTYTVTVNVADAALSEVFTLEDTLGAGLDFGAIDPGTDADFSCSVGNPFVCTLPAAT